MCLECNGWSHEQVLQLTKDDIEKHGFSVTGVEAERSWPGFAYTVGLTRYHGHPEILVSGLDLEDAADMLRDYGEAVREGVWFVPGDLLGGDGPHSQQLVHVVNPRHLVGAQEIYASRAGLVPALQVVWSDDEGHWPWDAGWSLGRNAQPLFGKPLR